MKFDNLRQRAAVVREVPLESVLIRRGAARDCSDRRKWRTEKGPLSVTGAKFMNWELEAGGGGAIDLVMHLAGCDYVTAVEWLEDQFGRRQWGATKYPAQSAGNTSYAPARGRPLRLPVADERMLGRVLQYLTDRRHVSECGIDLLLESGRLYADCRGNAVFLMVAGKPNRPVGAEVRGTGTCVWRGLAPGSRKNLGYFWIGNSCSQTIVLCESAIDAISCWEIHPSWICISTAGVRANPRWLPSLITRGYRIHCGFDADNAGDTQAARMVALYPSVRRLRPPAHDWNDVLASAR